MAKKKKDFGDKVKRDRFMDWFNHCNISRLESVPRSYFELAMEYNMIDMDMEAEAEEWAVLEIQHYLAQNLRRAKSNKRAYDLITQTLFEVHEYKRGIGKFPQSLQGMLVDYTVRALLALSKPLQTISNILTP